MRSPDFARVGAFEALLLGVLLFSPACVSARANDCSSTETIRHPRALNDRDRALEFEGAGRIQTVVVACDGEPLHGVAIEAMSFDMSGWRIGTSDARGTASIDVPSRTPRPFRFELSLYRSCVEQRDRLCSTDELVETVKNISVVPGKITDVYIRLPLKQSDVSDTRWYDSVLGPPAYRYETPKIQDSTP